MKFSKIYYLSLVASSLLMAENEISLEQISVTANREEEAIIDQALSIAAKGEDEIKLDQVVFQKDLMNSIAGVRIEQTGSIIGHMTSIRMPISTSPYYLFMQDGIPAQSSGFFNHNGLAYTTYGTASSVEILKGSGTALYGSDAVGGIINVQSIGRAKKDSSEAKVFGGSDGYLSLYAQTQKKIAEDRSFGINIKYSKSDGWREHTSYDRFEGNARYDAMLNDNNDISVLFSASSTDAEQADTFNDYNNILNGSKLASDDKSYFTALANTDIRRKFDYAKLSLEWNHSANENLDITTTPYVRYNRNRYVATWQPNLPSNDNELKTFGLLQKNSLKTAFGKLIYGFDAEFTKSSLEYDQTFDISARGKNYKKGAIYDYDVDYKAFAPYVSLNSNITDKLSVTAGARYDYNHFDYTNNLATGTDASGVYYRPTSKKDSFNHFSPKFSLSYQAQENQNGYFRYANGFRIPQATTLYSMKSGYQSADLDPEVTDTFELGYKIDSKSLGFVEVVGYYMIIDDTIARQRVKEGDDFYYNGGKSIHKGIELSLSNKITDEVKTKLAYSYSIHKYDNDAKFGNSEMANAPKNSANVRIFYTPKFINNLTAMAELIHVDKFWMDDAHAKEYKGYTIANLKLDYQVKDQLSVYGKIANIADKKYATAARFAYGRSDFTPGDPRQYLVGVEYKW